MAFKGANSISQHVAASNVVLDVSMLNIQQGDIMVLCVSVDKASATFTWPGGFNTIASLSTMQVASSEGTATCGITWGLAGATPPATLTVSTSGTNLYTLVCRVYSGRASAPLLVTPVKTGPVASGSVPITLSITGITPGVGDDVVLFVPAMEYGASGTCTYTPAATWINGRSDYTNTTFCPFIGSSDWPQWKGGATGTIAGTVTDSQGLNSGYGAYLLSLAALMPTVVNQIFTMQ